MRVHGEIIQPILTYPCHGLYCFEGSNLANHYRHRKDSPEKKALPDPDPGLCAYPRRQTPCRVCGVYSPEPRNGPEESVHTPVRVGLIEDRHVRRSQTGVQADETTVVTIAHAGGTAAAFAIMVGTPSCAVPIKILQGELLPAAGTYLVSPAGTGIGKALSRRLPFPGLMVRYFCFHFLTVFVFFDFHPVYYFNGGTRPR